MVLDVCCVLFCCELLVVGRSFLFFWFPYLFVDCCSLFVVLVSIVCCLLCGYRCALFVVGCSLMCGAWCVVCSMRSALWVVCCALCLLLVVCCWLCVVCRLSFVGY